MAYPSPIQSRQNRGGLHGEQGRTVAGELSLSLSLSNRLTLTLSLSLSKLGIGTEFSILTKAFVLIQ